MLGKEEILEILREWNYWDRGVEQNLHQRKEYLERIQKYLQTKEVIVLKGVRRCGKSTLLKLLISELYAEIHRSQILSVNFEDPRFYSHINLTLLEEIYDTYRTFVNPKEKCYILLDEIHYIPAWEKWVRKYRDLYPDTVKIIVTGSSSKLLDSEYSTALTGRTLPLTIFPLSFAEYLEFNGIKVDHKNILALNSKRREIIALLRRYLEEGGFPEVLLTGNKRLLQQYFDDLLYKDVIDRHEIRDTSTIRRIAHFLLTNVAKEYTYNSLRKTYGVSLDLVRQYVGYLEAGYLVFSVNRLSESLKEQSLSPRKVYCIDSGLRNVVGFKFSEDCGRIYENTVFIELKKRLADSLSEIYYWKGESGEVDFIIREGVRAKEAIQTCFDVSDKETRKRETTGLLEVMQKFRLKEGLIITEDYETEEKHGGKTIKFVPLWKWLLA